MSNARNISKADSRFVNATGDTMTGSMVVGDYTSGTTVEVRRSASQGSNIAALKPYGSDVIQDGPTITLQSTTPTLAVSQQLGANGELHTFAYEGSVGWVKRMTMDNAGRVTTPYQPYFLANNYGQAKAVGWQQVTFTTHVPHNVGGHYSASNSRFTAPVAGVYVFSTGGYIPVDNSTERYAFAFRVNAVSGGDTYIGGGTQPAVDAPLTTHTRAIKLNANDYVTVTMFTPYAETLGASFHRMWFNGYLLG